MRVYSPRPERSPFAAQAARHTTALVGIGHVGTRYATNVVLQFQAELAVAHAAVAAELPAGWPEANGFLGVASRVTSHREFLLRPDLGRRLDAASLEAVRARCKKGVDVQIIVADGLSAVAWCRHRQAAPRRGGGRVRCARALGGHAGRGAVRAGSGSRTRSARK